MVLRDDPMNPSPYLLFHQSPEQLRRIGARGGKAQARNRRDRLSGEGSTGREEIDKHLFGPPG